MLNFLTQRRVIDLTNELDQMGIVTSTLEYKGGHGRNRIVEKISSIAALLEILLQDFRLQAISKVPQEVFITPIKKEIEYTYVYPISDVSYFLEIETIKSL